MNKQEVAKYMKRLCEKGLTTCSGGNISYKENNKEILITASGTDKSAMKAKDVGIVDINGNKRDENIKLSMETGMHLNIYKERKDVKAVIHSHPLFSSAFSATNKEIEYEYTGEAVYLIKNIAYAGYKIMGSKELSEEVANKCKDADVIVMKNHGVIAIGKSLFDAFNKIEVLEYAAKLNFLVNIIGDKKKLNKNQVNAIIEMAG